MKRRQPAEALSEPPEHIRYIDMARYVDVIEESLRRRPGDTFHAALKAWRAWCRERHEWAERHGVKMADWRRWHEVMGATTGPDERWICDRYGLPFRPRLVVEEWECGGGPDAA